MPAFTVVYMFLFFSDFTYFGLRIAHQETAIRLAEQ